MDEWDRTEMGFPRALAESAAYHYANTKSFRSDSLASGVQANSAGELTLTWLEVFDESADSI